MVELISFIGTRYPRLELCSILVIGMMPLSLMGLAVVLDGKGDAFEFLIPLELLM